MTSATALDAINTANRLHRQLDAIPRTSKMLDELFGRKSLLGAVQVLDDKQKLLDGGLVAEAIKPRFPKFSENAQAALDAIQSQRSVGIPESLSEITKFTPLSVKVDAAAAGIETLASYGKFTPPIGGYARVMEALKFPVAFPEAGNLARQALQEHAGFAGIASVASRILSESQMFQSAQWRRDLYAASDLGPSSVPLGQFHELFRLQFDVAGLSRQIPAMQTPLAGLDRERLALSSILGGPQFDLGAVSKIIGETAGLKPLGSWSVLSDVQRRELNRTIAGLRLPQLDLQPYEPEASEWIDEIAEPEMSTFESEAEADALDVPEEMPSSRIEPAKPGEFLAWVDQHPLWLYRRWQTVYPEAERVERDQLRNQLGSALICSAGLAWAIITTQPFVPITLTAAASWNSWNGLLIMLRKLGR